MSLQTLPFVSGHAVFTRRAFDAAIRPLYAPLVHYAIARCGAVEAPDLVQSALACAWTVIERFDAAQAPGRLLLWLRCFVDYACDDHLRRLAVAPQEPLTAEEAQRQEERPARDTADLAGAYRAELGAMIARAGLTPRREACLRAWLDGRSQQAIARDLGLDARTVWEHIEDAKRRVRRCRIAEEITIREVFDAESNRARYVAPEPLGAALAREQLARLAAEDARHAALCRRAERSRHV